MIQTYVYNWSYECIHDTTQIRMYTLTEQQQTCIITVPDFRPYMYLELPTELEWTSSQLEYLYVYLQDHILQGRDVRFSLKARKSMYYARKTDKMKDVYTKCVLCSFSSNQEMSSLKYTFQKKIRIPELGRLQFHAHECNVSPILQFCTQKNLPHSGWIQISNPTVPDIRETYADLEFVASKDNIRVPKTPPLLTPKPMTLSFDIEVYSSVKGQFPNPSVAEDVVFQISAVFWQGDQTFPYLLTLGKVQKEVIQSEDPCTVLEYPSESDLLWGFIELMRCHEPHIITGWNILGFDIHYLIQRYDHHHMKRAFSELGLIRGKPCTELDESWSSSAYGKQSFKYYDWDGRIILDLLMFARREIKSENYKLETIASQFIGSHKDPITVHDIFHSYEQGVLTKRSNELLSLVGKYCLKDSILVQRLFEEFDIWIGITEMSAVCNVPASFLYSKGQQIKVYSQVYKYCYQHKIVMQTNPYECSPDEKCQGAYVRDPVPGIYEYVIPFDFSSLYPSIMIAYNIDYTTFVPDDSPIPDDKCHVIEWTEEHPHDVYVCSFCSAETRGERSETHLKWLDKTYHVEPVECEQCGHRFHVNADLPQTLVRKDKFQIPTKMYQTSYRYRFLKQEHDKGILPSIAEHLLDARKRTRQHMKELKKELGECTDTIRARSLKNHLNILNKRQLSYKVSCNSIYGVLGVQKGMLPLMPGAMCITAMGRYSVKKAAEHLRSVYHAEIVYGDTDSVYVRFPHIPPNQLWQHARHIEQEIYTQNIFPKPMKLEFEDAIYDPFFILTKKRYMWKYFHEDGTRSTEIGNKGVVLARRGTSLFLKHIYESLVDTIFAKSSKDDILFRVLENLNACSQGRLPHTDFVISKKVGDLEGYDTSRALPAHIRVAELMASRGEKVEVGQRLEYVVTVRGGPKAKVALKSEDVGYYQKHANILPIDYLYYIHLASKQLDELLEVSCRETKFVETQYKLRLQRHKIHTQLMDLFTPKLELV